MAESSRSAFPPLPAARAAWIRELALYKNVRDAEQAFVMEGAKPVLELLRETSPAVLAVVVTSTYLETADHALRHTLARQRHSVFVCRDSVFAKLSHVTTAQGILAVVRKPSWEEEVLLARPQLLGMYGESLQDPTNVGVIIRTAAAFGLDGLWLTEDSVDVFNPKIVRATAGTLLKLPVFVVHDLDGLRRAPCALVAAESSGQQACPIDEISSIPSRTILAFGNESRGLSQTTLDQAALRFHIPISRAVDSLNVAASAAIAAFWFSRLPRRNEGSRMVSGRP
jgi:TrmH family RNA methyltransferase